MILAKAGLAGLIAGFMLAAVPAAADVMEIGSDGTARWVAGAHVMDINTSATAGQIGVQPVEILPDDFSTPDQSIADPALHAQILPVAYASKVHELAARYDLSPTLIEALVWQESRWRPNARSWAGARGLAQLMPATAQEMGVNPDDPYANLEGGARYLRAQLDRFDGDLEKALAAYNAGPGRVERAGGIPNIRETQNYVAAIMGRLSNHSRSK
ncbi:MAG: lytic transglycosylase domain-containing protein [Sphingomonadaceae bacterium]